MAMFFSEAERDEAGASTNFLKHSRRVFLQDTFVSRRDQLYVPRESSCPIPLTHANVTRHVRDEYFDVSDMSTSAEQTPRSKHNHEGHSGPSPTCIDRALHAGLHAPDGLGHESLWSHDELRFDAASSSWHQDVRVRQLSSRSRTGAEADAHPWHVALLPFSIRQGAAVLHDGLARGGLLRQLVHRGEQSILPAKGYRSGPNEVTKSSSSRGCSEE